MKKTKKDEEKRKGIKMTNVLIQYKVKGLLRNTDCYLSSKQIARKIGCRYESARKTLRHLYRTEGPKNVDRMKNGRQYVWIIKKEKGDMSGRG